MKQKMSSRQNNYIVLRLNFLRLKVEGVATRDPLSADPCKRKQMFAISLGRFDIFAFIGGKYCGLHASRCVKIWPSGTKSLPTPDPNNTFMSYDKKFYLR